MNYKRLLKRKLLLLFGDVLIVFLSIIFAYSVRFNLSFNRWKFNKYIYIWIILSLAYVFCFYLFDQYNIRTRFTSSRSILLYIGSLISVALIITAIFYAFPFKIGRGIFFLSLMFTSVFSFLWRNIYLSVFSLAFPKRSVLLINGGGEEKELYNLLEENQDYEIIGILSDSLKEREAGFPHLGKIRELPTVINDYRIDDIVTTLEPISSDELIHGLVICKVKGISIYDFPTFYEILEEKLPVLRVKEKWFLYSNGFDRLGDRLYRRFKRFLDILISLIILLISLPLGLIILISIKIDSKGPVFYTQERLGKNEKAFRLLKFRTMKKNAESEEPRWAEINDKRITRVGRILRKLRFDELPQLINIFKGDMSVIGPRPERQFFIKKLKEEIPFYSLRFSVNPGLTGWAQVNYRYASSKEDAIEKLRFDLYYIKNMSFFLDIRILLRTVRIILFGMGR